MNQVTKKGDLRKQNVVEAVGGAIYLNGCLIGVYGAQHAAEKIANRLRVALGYPTPAPAPGSGTQPKSEALESLLAVTTLPNDAADEAPARPCASAATGTARRASPRRLSIRAEERERCAKECDRLAKVEWNANCPCAASAYKHAANCIRGIR